MDPIALITTALAAGAGAAVQDEAPAAVKGLYDALWVKVKHRLSSGTDVEVVLDGHVAAPEVWAWLSSELAAVGVSDDLVTAAQALMRVVHAEGSRTGKYDVDPHCGQGGDNEIQNSKFLPSAAQPSPVGGGGTSGMARITYQVEGEEERRVAVFLPGLKIEGRESDVARLGFPPVNLPPSGSPGSRRARSAVPTPDPVAAHLGLAPARRVEQVTGSSPAGVGVASRQDGRQSCMPQERWDESWHRLREWTNGQARSERLAAQLLIFDGYENVDPIHPLGGRDGGADILCTTDGLRCLAAVYFPMGQQRFKTIKDKFLDDFRKAGMQQPPLDRFIFVTNQMLTRAERRDLHGLAEKEATRAIEVVLYHLERVVALLDSPRMQSVRQQFLGIGGDSVDGPGGQGGSAYAIGDGSTAAGGDGGRGGLGAGGDGGHAVASGDRSVSIGGNGGDAAQPGGVGGRGGRGPLDRFGTPSSMWGVGQGGRGGSGEFVRLSRVLSGICTEYLQRFPQDAPFINAGLEQVPTDWLNQRLVELGEQWQVDGKDSIRTLRPLDG